MFKGREFECFGDLQSTINNLITRITHPLRIFNSQTAKDANRKYEAAGGVLASIDAQKWKYTYMGYR